MLFLPSSFYIYTEICISNLYTKSLSQRDTATKIIFLPCIHRKVYLRSFQRPLCLAFCSPFCGKNPNNHRDTPQIRDTWTPWCPLTTVTTWQIDSAALQHRQDVKERQVNQCLFYDLQPPWHGMLSRPWRLSRLGSHFGTRGGWHSLPGALCWTLLKCLPSLTFWLGSGLRVASRSQDLQARLSKPSLLMMLGFPAQGSFLTVQPPSTWAPSAVCCGPWRDEPGPVFVWCFRGKRADTQGLSCLLRHIPLFHCPGNQLSLRLWSPQEAKGGLNSAVFL